MCIAHPVYVCVQLVFYCNNNDTFFVVIIRELVKKKLGIVDPVPEVQESTSDGTVKEGGTIL